MYHNFFNGAGVGIGDVNNDGLADIYFCGNLVDNRLYLNKGNWEFEDITPKAGVACENRWSAGVSMVDVNGDGWLDIFVCQSGITASHSRYGELFTKYNSLFINNGNLTFTDRAAEYGVDLPGISTHASFFDYDKDGDLDLYLLNNAVRSSGGLGKDGDQRKIRDRNGGNRLFRNDNGHFSDVSEHAGIYGSLIGFGLGVTVADIDRDGWPDIYVSNDFFEKDYLYINNRNGTFSEKLEEFIRELSRGSMGADIADINNDGNMEIMVTEMTPEPEDRYKTKTVFLSWKEYMQDVTRGYYHQFARNVLQLNNGNNSFSEIGRFAGISLTDWSWGALIFDMDNDGWKDIFVANGIYKDLQDRDYTNLYSNSMTTRSTVRSRNLDILEILNNMPSVPAPNYAFRNNRDLTFTNRSSSWGLEKPSFSNGAAYGDLDNDGDFDLVINNVNMPPFIYRNSSSEETLNTFIGFKLIGNGKNPGAIGSRVTVFCTGVQYFQELIPFRGFQSSSDHRLIFGIGRAQIVDSAEIVWPDNRISMLYNLMPGRLVTVDIINAVHENYYPDTLREKPVFHELDVHEIISYTHHENEFNDFDIHPLLYEMISNEGPGIAVGDINRDGKEDVIIGGARGYPATMFMQKNAGKFEKIKIKAFEQDSVSEDIECLLFDANGDGANDLYITSGGNELSPGSQGLYSRFYVNDGKGILLKSDQLLPVGEPAGTACADHADIDGDGDQDLATGVRVKAFSYGLPGDGYILKNDGKGNFTDITDQTAPALREIGMITDMIWADIDHDDDQDLIVVGEYMPVSIFINSNGKLEDHTDISGLENSSGWWHTIEKADLDGDGDIDFVIGNHGKNSFFKASFKRPVTLYVNDFDRNGTLDHILCRFNGDKSYPVIFKDDLVAQIPSLRNKYPSFYSYKDQGVEDIFGQEAVDEAFKMNAVNFATSIMVNDGSGKFTLRELPAEAQFSPVYAILIRDFDGDGFTDILLGGNQYNSKPEAGIYDGSYGITLMGDGKGNFKTLSYDESGFFVKGQIRDIREISLGNRTLILVAVNNGELKVFEANQH
ncbi:MAG TPA: VCBS repeat-containing protein [Cyclobacteriaceae bacterium]|nr:VCBS repeat-containing protein [Cyclobacteriaceae bacterium]